MYAERKRAQIGNNTVEIVAWLGRDDFGRDHWLLRTVTEGRMHNREFEADSEMMALYRWA